MNWFDIFLIVLIAAWLAAAIIFIIKQKKKGKCIGCGCKDCSKCKRR